MEKEKKETGNIIAFHFSHWTELFDLIVIDSICLVW